MVGDAGVACLFVTDCILLHPLTHFFLQHQEYLVLFVFPVGNMVQFVYLGQSPTLFFVLTEVRLTSSKFPIILILPSTIMISERRSLIISSDQLYLI